MIPLLLRPESNNKDGTMKQNFTSLLVLLVGLAIFVGWPNPVQAMYQKLTEEQTNEAIDFGERNTMAEPTEFLEEWVVVLDNYDGYAFVITEFLALANASKESTLRGVPLTPFEIQDAISTSSGKLVFRVTTFGDTFNFAKDYTAILKVGDQNIASTFWTNSDGEAFGEDGNKPDFQADSEFYFPTKGIEPKANVTLVVQDKDGKTVTQFEFDLSKVR
jgi:hypothetical protein